VSSLRPSHDYSSTANIMSQADQQLKSVTVLFHSASRPGLSAGISAPIPQAFLATYKRRPKRSGTQSNWA
jgi:hypothetical protein